MTRRDVPRDRAENVRLSRFPRQAQAQLFAKEARMGVLGYDRSGKGGPARATRQGSRYLEDQDQSEGNLPSSNLLGGQWTGNFSGTMGGATIGVPGAGAQATYSFGVNLSTFFQFFLYDISNY